MHDGDGGNQRMVTCPVTRQRDYAKRWFNEATARIAQLEQGIAGLTGVAEDATARARASDAEVERLGAQVAEVEAELAVTRRGNEAIVREYGIRQHSLEAERDAALIEVDRLRQMISYALAGPDEDLPEALGGRAVVSVKKILRDALEGERGWLKVEGWPLWMKEAE